MSNLAKTFAAAAMACATCGCASSSVDLTSYAKAELGVSHFLSDHADLDEDGDLETVLYAKDPSWCGSGGCTMFILAPQGESYRLVSKTTIVNLPIRALATSTNGWHDLAVTVDGDGARPSYVAKLPFDGSGYASNPSVPPASLIDEPDGEVLIEAD